MPTDDQTPRPIRDRVRTVLDWVRAYVPPGARLMLGVILIAGGIAGFLPILGFWMIPLGVAIAALDVRPLVRWVQGRRRPHK